MRYLGKEGELKFGRGIARGYVTTGAYSLPVELPAGEIRLDFARPGGEAELAVVAVAVSTINSLWSTAAVIVALVIVVLIMKFWPRITRHMHDDRAPSGPRIALLAGYVLLLLLMTALFRLVGLVAMLVIVLLIEVLRRAPRKKGKRNGAA